MTIDSILTEWSYRLPNGYPTRAQDYEVLYDVLIETAKITGLDIAGIDLLFDEDVFKVCEANSSPGLKGLELAVGQFVAEQIIDYIIFRVLQK